MSDRGGFERGPRVLYHRGRPGVGCTSSKTVGHRGRLSGAALCAEFRGQVGGIGGWLAWSLSDRVQSRCRQNGVRCGRLSVPRCRARVALRRVFSAVHGRVQSGAGGVLRMRERVAHSVHAGRLDRVGWRGQGIMHGRSRSGAARGIGHGGQHKAGGEVTGLEVVGAGPARVGVHYRHGVDPGASEG
jgi:hypothetical protein